ncbi:MAG: nuclear transport factor 2 family protein [Bacteroidota bacterium]
MKKVVLLLFLAGALQASGQSDDKLSIRKLLNSQTIAWNNGDIESFMKGYWENDSLMFIGKSGITYGWNNTLTNYKKNYPDTASMGKLAFTLLVVKKLSSEYYQVIGKWHLQRSIGNLEGHFTLLFQKINGNWMIVSDHSS